MVVDCPTEFSGCGWNVGTCNVVGMGEDAAHGFAGFDFEVNVSGSAGDCG